MRVCAFHKIIDEDPKEQIVLASGFPLWRIPNQRFTREKISNKSNAVQIKEAQVMNNILKKFDQLFIAVQPREVRKGQFRKEEKEEEKKKKSKTLHNRNTDKVLVISVERIICQCFLNEDIMKQAHVVMRRSATEI